METAQSTTKEQVSTQFMVTAKTLVMLIIILPWLTCILVAVLYVVSYVYLYVVLKLHLPSLNECEYGAALKMTCV